MWVYRGSDVNSTCGSLIVTLGATTTSDACVDILSKLETRTDSQLEIKMYLLKGQLPQKCKRSVTCTRVTDLGHVKENDNLFYCHLKKERRLMVTEGVTPLHSAWHPLWLLNFNFRCTVTLNVCDVLIIFIHCQFGWHSSRDINLDAEALCMSSSLRERVGNFWNFRFF